MTAIAPDPVDVAAAGEQASTRSGLAERFDDLRKGRRLGSPNGKHASLDIFFTIYGIMLLVYGVGDRWIAFTLRVPGTPIFAGEVLLAFGLASFALHTWPVRRTIRREPAVVVACIFVTWAFIRLLPGISRHGLVAVRDAALTYYVLYGIMAASFGAYAADRVTKLVLTYVRILPYLVTFYPVAYALGALVNLPTMPGGAAEFLSVRPANMAVHSGLAIAATLLTPDHLLSERKRIYIAIVGATSCVLLATQNRSGFVAVCLMLSVAFIVRRPRGTKVVDRYLKIAAGLFAGLLIMWISGLSIDTDRRDREVSVEQFIDVVENLTSGGTAGDEALTTTVQFRNELWKSALFQVDVQEAWEIGLGFGVPLGEALLPFHGDGINELRNPHNSHLDILVRIGGIGLGLWITLWVTWAGSLIWRIRSGRLTPINRMLASMCMSGATAMLFVCYFDPTLETIQGSYWLQAMFGLGLVGSANLLPEPTAEQVAALVGSDAVPFDGSGMRPTETDQLAQAMAHSALDPVQVDARRIDDPPEHPQLNQ